MSTVSNPTEFNRVGKVRSGRIAAIIANSLHTNNRLQVEQEENQIPTISPDQGQIEQTRDDINPNPIQKKEAGISDPMMNYQKPEPPRDLSGMIMDHQKANAPKTKSGIVLDRYNTKVGDPVYDQDKADRLQRASKANLIGQAFSSLFNTALHASGNETFAMPDNVSGEVLGELKNMDQNRLQDFIRLREQAMRAEQMNINVGNQETQLNANIDQENKRMDISQANRIDDRKYNDNVRGEQNAVIDARQEKAYKQQEQLLYKERGWNEADFKRKSDIERENEWNSVGANNQEEYIAIMNETTKANNKYKNAVAGGKSKAQVDAEAKSKVLGYITAKKKELQAVLDDPDQFEQHETARKQKEFYEKAQLGDDSGIMNLGTEADEYYDNQFNTEMEGAKSAIFERIGTQGSTPENLKMLADYHRAKGMSNEEAIAQAKIDAQEMINGSGEVTNPDANQNIPQAQVEDYPAMIKNVEEQLKDIKLSSNDRRKLSDDVRQLKNDQIEGTVNPQERINLIESYLPDAGFFEIFDLMRLKETARKELSSPNQDLDGKAAYDATN
jgi:hypothetical protein